VPVIMILPGTSTHLNPALFSAGCAAGPGARPVAPDVNAFCVVSLAEQTASVVDARSRRRHQSCNMLPSERPAC